MILEEDLSEASGGISCIATNRFLTLRADGPSIESPAELHDGLPELTSFVLVALEMTAFVLLTPHPLLRTSSGAGHLQHPKFVPSIQAGPAEDVIVLSRQFVTDAQAAGNDQPYLQAEAPGQAPGQWGAL